MTSTRSWSPSSCLRGAAGAANWLRAGLEGERTAEGGNIPPRDKKKQRQSRKRSAPASRKSAARKTRRAAGSRAGASRKSARKTAASRKGAAKRGSAKGAAKRGAAKSARTAKRSTSRKPSASTRRVPSRPSPAAAPTGDESKRHNEPEDVMGGGNDELMDEDAELDLGGEEGGGETDIDEDM